MRVASIIRKTSYPIGVVAGAVEARLRIGHVRLQLCHDIVAAEKLTQPARVGTSVRISAASGKRFSGSRHSLLNLCAQLADDAHVAVLVDDRFVDDVLGAVRWQRYKTYRR